MFFPKRHVMFTQQTFVHSNHHPRHNRYHDGFLYGVACQVVEAAALHSGWKGRLNCTTPVPTPTYKCGSGYDNASCVPRTDGTGTTLAACLATCR